MGGSQWTLESLNKAYQQGYMTGLAGKQSDQCPYQDDILISAWEAGWDDGTLQYEKAMKERREIRLA